MAETNTNTKYEILIKIFEIYALRDSEKHCY